MLGSSIFKISEIAEKDAVSWLKQLNSMIIPVGI